MIPQLQPKATLVVYLTGNPHFADLCLASIGQQTEQDFELIIIADGASDIARHVQSRLPLLPQQSKVVWTHDLVHYATSGQQLLAGALQHATSEYLIFTDSDCILHPQYVKEHVQHRAALRILSGRRVELSDAMSVSLSQRDITDGTIQSSYHRVIMDGLFGQSLHVSRGIYCANPILQRLISTRSRYVYASNFSLYRSDAGRLLVMNGIADEYTLIRNAGMHITSVTNIAVQYHCSSNSHRRLVLASDMFEKVLKLRYNVSPEYGWQPAGALLEAQRKTYRQN
ncbi:MAG: glycosyltransferase [Candidatus Kapabacteria bacterium]|nr:glycosyltransferase [Candidatus Kapabacteria bacterium]